MTSGDIPDSVLSAGPVFYTLDTGPAMCWPVECIAPVVVDGGTRFGLDIGDAANPHPEFGEVAEALQRPTTREQEQAWRNAGGRTVDVPRPDADPVTMVATVTGSRREGLALYLEDVVHVRVNIELWTARVQLKARGLWALGYEPLAREWLSTVNWWMTSRRTRLDRAHSVGWRTTGLELCSDFTGLDFADTDAANFVGFRKNERVRVFGRDGAVETINLGTRASPVSVCLYDKDEQLAAVKGGDDSIYRAMHVAHGWNGEMPRRRVEFRVTGRALHYADDEHGQVLDFRDPAELASHDHLCDLWRLLAHKKRLIVPSAATRRTRAPWDDRWQAVERAAGVAERTAWRQVREAQTDAWLEAVRRCSRDAHRSLLRLAALHDLPQPDLGEVVAFLEWAGETDVEGYLESYRKRRDPFIGPEITTLGRARWRSWLERND